MGKAKRRKLDTANPPPSYFCEYCQVACTSLLQLSTHISERSHIAVLNCARPDLAPHMLGLQYFLDTYMRDEPLVGLEYIVEERGDVYKYRCQLCEVWSPRNGMITHIDCFMHKMRYLAHHHPDDLAFLQQFAGKGHLFRMQRLLVGEIHRKHGKKRIQEGTVGPAPLKPSKWDNQKLPSFCDDPGLPVLWRFKDAEAAQKIQSTMLQDVSQRFKQNSQFYGCLRSLEIRDVDNAVLVKEIARNCIKEVMRFHRTQTSEQAEECQGSSSSSHPAPAYTDGNDGRRHSQSLVPPNRLVPSGSQCTDASILVPEADDYNDPTEICFSGPQNMEMSDSAALLKEAQLQILRLERLVFESEAERRSIMFSIFFDE